MVAVRGPSRALLLLLVALADARRGRWGLPTSCFHAQQMQPGRCELLSRCPSGIRELQRGGRPQLCGFPRGEPPGPARMAPTPIVCCPTESKRRHEDSGDKMMPPETCDNFLDRSRSTRYETVSERKCTEYARAACLMSAPLLTASAPSDGEPAGRMEFPHMALLGYGEDPDALEWQCGGSLISPDWVLTAAHCLGNARARVSHVLLGVLDRSEAHSDGAAEPSARQLLAVAEAVPHPEYSVAARYHDVALLRLASPATLSRQGVRPACLHTDMDADLDGAEATATGWGATGFGEDVSERLVKVNLTIRAQQDCRARFNARTDPKLRHGFSDGQMCAGGGSGRDTCQGDSGGPLQVAASGDACLYRIVGVVSYGPSCGVGLPGVYTRVAHYVPWIESVVWRRAAAPSSTCGLLPRDGNALRLPDTGNGTLARRACRSFILDWCSSVGPLAMQPGLTPRDACHFQAAVGEPVDPLDYPHMAILVYGDDYNNEEVGCLASLISPQYLVTAARCATLRCLPVRRALLGVTGSRASLGRHYRSKSRQEVAVAEVVVHPEYAADRRHHDIALLRLARPVAPSPQVRPACLHTPQHGPEWGLRAAATGWEASGHWQAVDGELRRSQLTVLQPEACRGALPSLRESQLCTDRACNNTFPGEPGGPLQVLQHLLEGQDGLRLMVHRLLGVESLAPPCGRCLPDVYSRVAAFLPWIESVVWPDASAP